jgi:hypothetical protein
MAEQLVIARVGALLGGEGQAPLVEDVEDRVGLVPLGRGAGMAEWSA